MTIHWKLLDYNSLQGSHNFQTDAYLYVTFIISLIKQHLFTLIHAFDVKVWQRCTQCQQNCTIPLIVFKLPVV